MRERGDRPRLALETRESLLVAGELFRKHFDRDFPAEPQVAGAVHLAHSSRAQRRENLVAIEEGPGDEGHAVETFTTPAATPAGGRASWPPQELNGIKPSTPECHSSGRLPSSVRPAGGRSGLRAQAQGMTDCCTS